MTISLILKDIKVAYQLPPTKGSEIMNRNEESGYRLHSYMKKHNYVYSLTVKNG